MGCMPESDPTAQFQQLVADIENLTDRERLIGAYVSIREIPYGSPNSPSPLLVIERNRGTAKGKHMLLKLVLTSLGYEVQEHWARHDLGKLPIDPWPEALEDFRGKPLTGFHDFLKVKVGDVWVTVDATYDKALLALGFPVHDWDGVSDIPLPVSVLETFEVEPPIDDHKKRLVTSLPEEEQLRRKKFLQTLKKWVEEERTKLKA